MKFVRDLIHTGVANDVSRHKLRFKWSICMFLQRETLGPSDVSDAELNIVNRLGRECVMKSAAHRNADQEGFPAICLALKRSHNSEHIVHSGSHRHAQATRAIQLSRSSILVPACGKLIPLRGSKANGASATRFSWISSTTPELSSRLPEFCAVRTIL